MVAYQHLPLNILDERRQFSTSAGCLCEPTKTDLGKLVYTGPNNSSVKLVKYFSLSTSAIGVLLQPYLLSQMINNGLAVKMTIVSFTAFFVLGTPFLLHYISKRYVMQMYYNDSTNTFTACQLNFFAREKRFSFTPDDISDSLASPLCNYKVGERSLLLDTDLMRDEHVDAYIAFMRYDKPIDLSKYTSRSNPSEYQEEKEK